MGGSGKAHHDQPRHRGPGRRGPPGSFCPAGEQAGILPDEHLRGL